MIRKPSPIALRRGFARCQQESDRLARRRARCSAIFGSSSSNARSSRPRSSQWNASGACQHRARQRRRARGDAGGGARGGNTRREATPVELSKRGGAGYLQLLLAANDVRAMGRMARGVAAVAELDRARLETHRRTLAAERTALNELEQQRAAMVTLQRDAARARAAVEAAVNARGRLIDDLDQRRDLAAQFVVELQQAQLQLERTIATADTSSTVTSLPIRPFQGDLAWPVDGKIASRFGRSSSGRFGTSIVRNGIELATAQGNTVSAVHEGTVAFAGPFAGFGTLVIVDHGNSAFTLYGHLIEAAVSAGTNVSRGTALGKVGLSPSGGPALYFELRIDGRPVDPLQWLARH